MVNIWNSASIIDTRKSQVSGTGIGFDTRKSQVSGAGIGCDTRKSQVSGMGVGCDTRKSQVSGIGMTPNPTPIPDFFRVWMYANYKTTGPKVHKTQKNIIRKGRKMSL